MTLEVGDDVTLVLDEGVSHDQVHRAAADCKLHVQVVLDHTREAWKVCNSPSNRMDEIVLYDSTGNRFEDAKKDECLREVLGVRGTADKDKAECIRILYDFAPCNIHDPILLT